MLKERVEKIYEIIKKYRESHDIDDKEIVSVGPSRDNILSHLNSESEEAKELREMGFVIIYPAELSSESIESMDLESRANYEKNLDYAMIVDGQEKELTFELSAKIAKHFGRNIDFYGYDGNNAILYPTNNLKEQMRVVSEIISNNKQTLDSFEKTEELVGLKLKEGEKEKLSEIYSNIGYATQKDEYGRIVIGLDNKINEQQLANIYGKNKGKNIIKFFWKKIKDAITGKNNKKEIDSKENEKE